LMTNIHASCECEASGRSLTFLLPNDAY